MDQLTIPNKLYGRDPDVVTLLESFERISSGHGEVLLVPGSSGVGKTALVQELQSPIRDRNGFFVRGKFDQYQQNIPYFAFRQALAELCRELQSGDAQQRSRFKAAFLQAVGNLGQVLVDLVPELEALLGAQPPLGEISPQEARHRFADVFRNFLKVICRPEHPLVLFIDDWQWADAASCELLKQMQVGLTLRYLLVIVSYRDNEVDSGHPLMSAVNDLRSHAVSVEVLQVKEITLEDVRELVADTLKPAAEDVEGLAALIHGRTRGNPFFVRSFLGFLHEFKLLSFDKTRKCWHWRIDAIGEADLPGNVVELFGMKLRRLDRDSRDLFSLAACLGNRFDMETLSIISGRTSAECLALLFSGQAKTLLLPFDGNRRGNPGTFMFLHDRVQQAAYMLIEPAELPNILLKIGRLLLASLQPEQLAERLFEVVSDLNAGHHLMRETEERVNVVQLNITAGRKAYAATAYRSALQFYRAANRFLETPGFAEYLWRDHHAMTMSLFKGRAECEFLEGNHAEAENCIQQAVIHAGTAIEKASTLNNLIIQYTLLARYPEAIAAGRQALAALGISLPEEGYEEARNYEIAQVRQELKGRPISSLIELPVMSHPEMLMASKILITMGPPCYRSHQRLWAVIVPKVVNLTLHYGNIPQVGYSHTAFGGLLGWVDNDYASAKEFGELATRLMTGTFRAPSDQSVFYLMIGSSIRHWFRHLRYGAQDYQDAFEIGLRSGNLQYAAYAFGHNMYCQFYQGVPLAGLIQETQHSLDFSRTRLNQWAIDLLEGGLNVFGALSGGLPALNGKAAWSEEQFLRQVGDHHNIQVTCIYKVLKTFSLLIFCKNEEALVLSDETEPLIYTVGTQGLLPWPEHVFARLLILTALYSTADKERQTKWRVELAPMINRLRIWADNCPENFKHKYLLAAAELARIDSRPFDAMQLYDAAVEEAQAGNFLQWVGMTNERAYRFLLECGNERLAHVYWQQAYVCYSRWGAGAKVRLMEAEYRTHLAETLPGGKGAGKQEPENAAVLVEKQVKQLRNYALQMQQARLRIEAAAQAEELAHAMQRLRVEIAGRKRTEEALRESEARYSLTLDALNDGLWDWNVPTGAAFFSPNYYLLLGYDAGEFPASYASWRQLVHPEDLNRVEEELRLSIENGKGFTIDLRMKLKSGEWRWVSTRGRVVERDAEGKAVRMVGTLSDITERKQSEEVLRAAREAAEKAARAKSEFFANMSHELRTPLNAILGFSELLRHDAGIPGKHRKTLDIINRSGEHLLSLINDVLDMAKIEAGRINVQNAPFDLGGMVRDLADLMRGRAEEKNLELRLEQAADIPLCVRADGAKLRQVFLNLVGNAIKFTPQGRVLLRLSATPDEAPQRLSLIFEVEDTGIGIAAGDLAHIFDPFVQVGNPAFQAGTGLGLAIARRQVEQMGGRISVESEPGKGSLFRVEVPADRVEVSEAAVAKTDSRRVVGLAPGGPAYRILIVEDQMENWLLLQRLLEGAGFQVRVAQNGAEGLELFQAWRPHFIWMDVRMPVMDGLEAARRIRALANGRDVKIVAVTAAVFKEERDNIMSAGMDAFIRKPFRPDEIFDCLASHLGVSFIYEPASDAAGKMQSAPRQTAAVASLPLELREELARALVSLDGTRIHELIQRIAGLDQKLGVALAEHAERLEYTKILQALKPGENNSTKESITI